MWSLGTAFLVVATRNWDPANIMCVNLGPGRRRLIYDSWRIYDGTKQMTGFQVVQDEWWRDTSQKIESNIRYLQILRIDLDVDSTPVSCYVRTQEY